MMLELSEINEELLFNEEQKAGESVDSSWTPENNLSDFVRRYADIPVRIN